MASACPIREDELRLPVQKLFPPEQYFCKSEVPFGLKRIDMVFRRRSNNQEIVAVELKLTKWRKAVWQATANRQIATYSYVALPVAKRCRNRQTAHGFTRLGTHRYRLGGRCTDCPASETLALRKQQNSNRNIESPCGQSRCLNANSAITSRTITFPKTSLGDIGTSMTV